MKWTGQQENYIHLFIQLQHTAYLVLTGHIYVIYDGKTELNGSQEV